MKIAIGCDHAGYELRAFLLKKLQAAGHEVRDYGTESPESVDYPDFAHPISEAVEAGTVDFGILICGSANGMVMAANKHQGVRCALCWNEEVAALAKQHNNANAIALPSRFISLEDGWRITEAFMNATFEGGRHERRVNKIACS